MIPMNVVILNWISEINLTSNDHELNQLSTPDLDKLDNQIRNYYM